MARNACNHCSSLTPGMGSRGAESSGTAHGLLSPPGRAGECQVMFNTDSTELGLGLAAMQQPPGKSCH